MRNPEYPVCHVGSTMQSIYIPLEHLHIPPGQALNGKCPESCTRDMIRFAATTTDVRKKKILDLVKEMKYKEVPTISNFGITVGGTFTQVLGSAEKGV